MTCQGVWRGTRRAAESEWTPGSWRAHPIEQQPPYSDRTGVDRVAREIARSPPLVTVDEVDALRARLAAAARGDIMVLQAGDCAERFDSCCAGYVGRQLDALDTLASALSEASRRPVVRVGRIAGQYAKPRSELLERRGPVELPGWQGDLVNGPRFDHAERAPDPTRMLHGYERAAWTMNLLRAWAGPREAFVSHEGLLLPYEQAQTHLAPTGVGWYDLSTHFPWIGMRTANLDGAHTEFFRGIRNPIAVKIGPATGPDLVARMTELLDPDREPGRLTLIHRLGASGIADRLPPLLQAVRVTGRRVVWLCDPMHGNGRRTPGGTKVRFIEDIERELRLAVEIHSRNGSVLGGLHLELTGADVTECTDTTSDRGFSRLSRATFDPRLNLRQALALVSRVADLLARAG